MDLPLEFLFSFMTRADWSGSFQRQKRVNALMQRCLPLHDLEFFVALLRRGLLHTDVDICALMCDHDAAYSEQVRSMSQQRRRQFFITLKDDLPLLQLLGFLVLGTDKQLYSVGEAVGLCTTGAFKTLGDVAMLVRSTRANSGTPAETARLMRFVYAKVKACGVAKRLRYMDIRDLLAAVFKGITLLDPQLEPEERLHPCLNNVHCGRGSMPMPQHCHGSAWYCRDLSSKTDIYFTSGLQMTKFVVDVGGVSAATMFDTMTTLLRHPAAWRFEMTPLRMLHLLLDILQRMPLDEFKNWINMNTLLAWLRTFQHAWPPHVVRVTTQELLYYIKTRELTLSSSPLCNDDWIVLAAVMQPTAVAPQDVYALRQATIEDKKSIFISWQLLVNWGHDSVMSRKAKAKAKAKDRRPAK